MGTHHTHTPPLSPSEDTRKYHRNEDEEDKIRSTPTTTSSSHHQTPKDKHTKLIPKFTTETKHQGFSAPSFDVVTDGGRGGTRSRRRGRVERRPLGHRRSMGRERYSDTHSITFVCFPKFINGMYFCDCSLFS